MKVMLVEDSLLMQRMMQEYLHSWNYEVVVAEHGGHAWELFQNEHVPLIVSDWIMPEMDGLELVRRIRAAELVEYVYIILLTSKSEKEDLVTAMDAGADDFLVKPVDERELRVRLREGVRIIELERKLAEQNRQLREAQVALVQSEKLAGLGQLAAGMAHEINNPIAYVSNNLTVLQRDIQAVLEILEQYQRGRDVLATAAPELAATIAELEDEHDVGWIQQNVARLFHSSLDGLSRVRDIVKNLRGFARLDEARFDKVDLNAALESTLEMARYELTKKQMTVQTQFAPLPPTPCSPGEINQVFLNLILNAIHASEPGSVVEVCTGSDAETVIVEIKDQGSGIAENDLPHIFDPFFTTKPVGEGTGLGLSISYGIIQKHKGTIEVDSEVSRGSTFRIRLPLQADAETT